jgi:hypothetical protein
MLKVTREVFRDTVKVAEITEALQRTFHALSVQGTAYQRADKPIHASESYAKGMMIAHSIMVLLSVRIYILEERWKGIEEIPQETLDFVEQSLRVSLEAGTPYDNP